MNEKKNDSCVRKEKFSKEKGAEENEQDEKKWRLDLRDAGCDAANIMRGGCVPAYAAGTVTRTTRIDLSTMTTAEDHLSSEGWKWEPTADGGTLTLRDFYMKASHKEKYAHALIQGKGNVVIVLEGENVIETTSSWYWPLLSGDGKTVNWTIREGEKGSSLEFKMPESTAKNHLPYGMAGEKVTIESGTIRAKMILSMSDSFEMTGGTVIIDGTRSGAAIETMKDDAILTGGKLKITEGDYGISARCMDNWPPEKRKIVIDGADVEIKSGVCALIGNPILYLNGNLNISGGTRAASSPIQTTINGTGNKADGSENVSYDPNKNNGFTSFEAKHTHAAQADKWGSDDSMHWPLCECGKVMDAQTQTHQYTEEHDELEHWQGCICGRKKNVEPHRFGEWVEARKPTRTESGLRTRRCSVCGFNEEEKIPAVNLPQTGDSTHPGQYALLLAFCGLTLALLRRRRTNY